MADREKIQQALDRFIKHVTSRAKANLTNKDRNVSKKLYNSIKGEYKVMPNSIGLYFTMEEYGQYQDQGVKGKKSSAKAPKSPFKFGSGTGKKGGLTQEIQKWVEKRRFQFKDERGKFMSYKSTAWVITKSIYAKGLKPTMFFTKPFQEAYKNLPEEIAREYGLEINELFKISLKK